MKLKNITFVLENCDSITIDGKYIGDFYVGDIKREIKRIASNAICEMNITNNFMIEIHKDANVKRCDFFDVFSFTDKENSHMTFDRFLECNDITSIDFVLEEESNDFDYPCKAYSYYVNWVGDSDYVNEAQKTYLSKAGHLYIVISKEEYVSDFFDLEEINDEDEMAFKFSMYDVGDENQISREYMSQYFDE